MLRRPRPAPVRVAVCAAVALTLSFLWSGVAHRIGERHQGRLRLRGAAAILLTLPVFAFAFIAQTYMVAGLTSGSVKG
jgi:ABC-type maltose transport system permease subunit